MVLGVSCLGAGLSDRYRSVRLGRVGAGVEYVVAGDAAAYFAGSGSGLAEGPVLFGLSRTGSVYSGWGLGGVRGAPSV